MATTATSPRGAGGPPVVRPAGIYAGAGAITLPSVTITTIPRGAPGFAVLTRPKIIVGSQDHIPGVVARVIYPPTPTGKARRVLQIFRGPEADLPHLYPGELAATTDTYGLFVGDGAYEHYIGGAPVSVPAHSNSPGKVGQWAWDGTYLYQCVATNTWVRIAVTGSF